MTRKDILAVRSIHTVRCHRSFPQTVGPKTDINPDEFSAQPGNFQWTITKRRKEKRHTKSSKSRVAPVHSIVPIGSIQAMTILPFFSSLPLIKPTILERYEDAKIEYREDCLKQGVPFFNREQDVFQSHDNEVIVSDIDSENDEADNETEDEANFDMLDEYEEPILKIFSKPTFRFKRKIGINLDKLNDGNVTSFGDKLFNQINNNNNYLNNDALLQDMNNDNDQIKTEVSFTPIYERLSNPGYDEIELLSDNHCNILNNESQECSETFNPLANFTTLMSYTDPYIVEELSNMFYDDTDTTPEVNSGCQYDNDTDYENTKYTECDQLLSSLNNIKNQSCLENKNNYCNQTMLTLSGVNIQEEKKKEEERNKEKKKEEERNEEKKKEEERNEEKKKVEERNEEKKKEEERNEEVKTYSKQLKSHKKKDYENLELNIFKKPKSIDLTLIDARNTNTLDFDPKTTTNYNEIGDLKLKMLLDSDEESFLEHWITFPFFDIDSQENKLEVDSGEENSLVNVNDEDRIEMFDAAGNNLCEKDLEISDSFDELINQKDPNEIVTPPNSNQNIHSESCLRIAGKFIQTAKKISKPAKNSLKESQDNNKNNNHLQDQTSHTPSNLKSSVDHFMSVVPDVEPIIPAGYNRPDYDLVRILMDKGYLTSVEGFHLKHGYYLLGTNI